MHPFHKNVRSAQKRLGNDGMAPGQSRDGVGEERVGQGRVGEQKSLSPATQGTKERIEQALARDEKLPDKDRRFLKSVTELLSDNRKLTEHQAAWLKDALP